MSESKDDLVEQAEGLGINSPGSLNKDQLREQIARRESLEVGVHVPPGQLNPEPLEPSGKAVTGVQPVEASDIPDAGL